MRFVGVVPAEARNVAVAAAADAAAAAAAEAEAGPDGPGGDVADEQCSRVLNDGDAVGEVAGPVAGDGDDAA